jgi:hypothetical protein
MEEVVHIEVNILSKKGLKVEENIKVVECAVLAFYTLLEENFALMAIIVGAQFQHIVIMVIV